jgi:D-methionine transport system ATP-binding protein
VDFNIMHGQIEYVADHPFGTLIASVAAEPELLTKLIADLTSTRNTVEHLGYVA